MKLQHVLPIALSLLLTSCSVPLTKDAKAGVEISGVNYSDQPITYAISDPADAGSAGAEPLDPFAGGGIMCCYRLPEKWQPGIKVRVQIFDTRRDPVKDEIVELPPYVDGKPGRIWVVHYQDGSVDVLTSDYGPPHAKWPGKVKGWPVPTVEYRRALWEKELDFKKSDVKAAQELLNLFKKNPDEYLKRAWENDSQHQQEKIKRFSGPKDPAYKEYVLKDHEQYLDRTQQRLNDWLRKKP